ncbi:hypothetical protein, partial [Paraburkholderia sp.]|uniref:hypothetical protein n=1 Tax=Paraburkholderia sp. TaxID=1926495 RepID=UPI002AFF48A0
MLGELPAALGFGFGLFGCAAIVCLFAYGVGLVACARLFALCFYGVGLSLISYWSISVAPVRGGHLLFFACRKEKLGKRKRLKPRTLKRVPWLGGG